MFWLELEIWQRIKIDKIESQAAPAEEADLSLFWKMTLS